MRPRSPRLPSASGAVLPGVGAFFLVGLLLAMTVAVATAGPALAPAGLPVSHRLGFPPAARGPVPGARPAGSPGGPVYGVSNLGSIPVKDTPTVASYDSRDGYLYVTNFGAPTLGGNTVTIIDDHNNTALTTVPVGDDPLSSAYDPADGYDYVLNFGTTDNLSVFNGTSEFASVPTGPSPVFALYNPADGDMFVSNQASGNISIVNGTTVVASPVVGNFPGISTYDPRNQYVYVPNTGSNNVSILNGTTIVGNVSVGNSPIQAIYDPANGWVYVTNSLSNNVSIINGTRLYASVPGGGGPNRAGYDPATGDILVVDTGTNTVVILNGTTLVSNLSVGVFPRNVVYDSSTQEVYVPNWNAASVSVINGTSVVATVSVGSSPYSVTYDSGDSEVYVVNFNSANVSVLGSPPNASNVTVHAIGLPNGTLWGVRVGATSYPTSAANVSFPEPNGTYNWSALPVDAFSPVVGSGSFSVLGASVQLNITFVPAYPITFSESGLGPGEYWNVTIPPAWNGSVNTTQVLWEPNGSYAYTLEPVAGYETTWTGQVNVSGSGVRVNVSFTQVVYPVTFQESGLTPGTAWQAGIGLATNNSTTNDVVLWEPNGSYTYVIPPVAGYVVGLSSGPVQVNGTGPTVPVAFAPTYLLTFFEQGLPTGAPWAVQIGNLGMGTTASNLSFNEPNGSVSYAVTTNEPGYHPNATHGSIPISGGPANVTLGFSVNVTVVENYTVTFEESGLVGGTNWTVSFGSLRNWSRGLVLSFSVPNDTYNFSASASGYSVTPPSGTVLVDGPGSYASPIRLTFQRMTHVAPPVNYTIAFVEQNLPTGTAWGVGVNQTVVRGTTATLELTEPNGTWTYRVVGPLPGYATAWSGQVTVAGGNRTLGVSFHKFLYEAQFAESGLAGGTTWNVTLGSDSNASSGAVITFWEPNGTYTYSFAPIGGYPPPTSGSLLISGSAPPTVNVVFAGSSSNTGTLLGLPFAEGAAVLGVLILAVFVVLAVLLLRGRTGPPPREARPDESTSPTDADLET